MFRSLFATVVAFVFAGSATAAPILTTVGVPNGATYGAVTGSATVTGFAPILENFQGFPSNGSLTLATTPSLNGTGLGGGAFQIGKPGNGAAPIFNGFANQMGNLGLTLLAGPSPDPISFLATGAPFTSLGFLWNDFGDANTDDEFTVRVYSDLAGTNLIGSFIVDVDSVTGELIGGTEVAFIGVSSDVPFARLDFFTSGGLVNDSIQIDDVRGTLAPIPEPGTLLTLSLVGFFGGYAVRRKLKQKASAEAVAQA